MSRQRRLKDQHSQCGFRVNCKITFNVSVKCYIIEEVKATMKKSNQNKSILVVEDEAELAEIYRVILEQSGYDVTVAHNGKIALEKVVNSPDLILLDLRMPIMNGVEFLEKYSLKEHPKVKVIVFSNYDLQDEIDDAYRLGAERYMLKAWASPKELLQIVKDTIG